MKLLNKNAFITGGSSGIGAAIATLFAKEGASISFCHYNDDSKANHIIKTINQFSKKNFAMNIDIGSKKNCENFYEQSIKEIGQPDILVNNAGIIFARPFEEATEEEFDNIMAKFEGGFYFTRGPYGERGKGRAFFMMDPDGNESEINTRYLYGRPQRFDAV